MTQRNEQVQRYELGIQRLRDMTRSGQIKWRDMEDSVFSALFKRADMIGHAYMTDLQGKRVVLYEVEVENRDEDGRPFKYRLPVIEFVDNSTKMELEWPMDQYRSSARDLLNTVREQVSGADKFLRDLLGEFTATEDYERKPKK